MELDEKITKSSQLYKNNCDDEIKQCCILKNVIFHAYNKEFNGITLTPICDIYNGKADYLVIAQLILLKDFYEIFLFQKGLNAEQVCGRETVSEKKFNKTYTNFKKDFLKNNVYRFYFLPKNEWRLQHSIIDFNLVESIIVEDFKNYEKICEIKSPWKEDIVASYTSYCVRIGTYEYSNEFLEEVMSDISQLKQKNK